MSYRIKSVAALTGITAATLRAWERRYDLVSPRRTESGYRVYSEDDIEMLVQVKTLVEKGYRVGEAIELVRRDAPVLPPGELSAESAQQIRDDLFEATLALDRTAAERITTRMAPLPYDRQIGDILFPVLRRVGDLWEKQEVRIVHEHFLSVFVRERLTRMLDAVNGGRERGPEAVFGGISHQMHEFGLMATALHLATSGWKITYLGIDIPPDDLHHALMTRRPAVFCTAVLNQLAPEEALQLAAQLRGLAPPETTVVLGGAGIPSEVAGHRNDGTYLLRSISEFLDLMEDHEEFGEQM